MKPISEKCLNPIGHDFVSINRDNGNGSTEWMECYNCKMSIVELEQNEKECIGHIMRCIRCGSPMMQSRVVEPVDEEIMIE